MYIGSWIFAYIHTLIASKHAKNDWNPLYLTQCKQTLLHKEWMSNFYNDAIMQLYLI